MSVMEWQKSGQCREVSERRAKKGQCREAYNDLVNFMKLVWQGFLTMVQPHYDYNYNNIQITVICLPNVDK